MTEAEHYDTAQTCDMFAVLLNPGNREFRTGSFQSSTILHEHSYMHPTDEKTGRKIRGYTCCVP